MTHSKSSKYCPRCDRELPISAFDARPRINGRSNGYRPRCRECTAPWGKSLKTTRIRESIPEPNPSGLCLCGCGGKTPIALQSVSATGVVTGKPVRYIAGHQSRKDRFYPGRYTVDPETGCWNWNGARYPSGYGVWGGKNCPRCAHRAYYERDKGPIPEGLQLDHLCRNRGCVNPDHLEPVTLTENLRRGAGTKLTVDKVREIRRLWETGQYNRPMLSKMYGVASTTIEQVVHRYNWKDVA